MLAKVLFLGLAIATIQVPFFHKINLMKNFKKFKFQAIKVEDFSSYKPHHYQVPKFDLNQISLQRFKDVVLENNEPLSTERYPDYKRGTENFASKFENETISQKLY